MCIFKRSFTLGASVELIFKMSFSAGKYMKTFSFNGLKGHLECVKCEYEFVLALE